MLGGRCLLGMLLKIKSGGKGEGEGSQITIRIDAREFKGYIKEGWK